MNVKDDYRKMWEDFGKDKSFTYSGYKFEPTYRVGLTNYLRESIIYKYLKPKKEDTVLDAGCAAGRQLFQISSKVKTGYGTDIAESFIKKAKQLKEERKVTNLHFQQSQLENLPFDDGFFDKVICAEVLEHVEDKDSALKELSRVLKPRGVLVISVPHLNADATLWGRFLRLFHIRNFTPINNFSNNELNKHGDAHVREFTIGKMKNWLENNNFEVESISDVSFIDGPGFDFMLKFPLHVTIFRRAIITFEKWLNKANLPFGRHLVVRCKKLK